MDEIRYGPPLKLYDLCINAAIVDSTPACILWSKDFRLLPSTTLLDFYERLFQERRLCVLTIEFKELDVFSRLLHVKGKRSFLLRCYQTILNHGSNISTTLVNTFTQYIKLQSRPDKILIDMGLRIGSFLCDGGWFVYSLIFLTLTATLILKLEESKEMLKNLLECYKLKIYAESLYCKFNTAKSTMKAAQDVVKKLEDLESVPNLAVLYSNFSAFYFLCSEYDESYKWAQKSVSLLTNDLPKRDVIEVLRQASKSCVVKREFLQSGLLIRQAMNLGEILHGKDQLPTFSNVLADYGFYLLYSDAMAESMQAYERALNYRLHIFERNNIYIALAHEDFAYVLYVTEYSSGRFKTAEEHAETSISMMEKLLPKDHLMLASAKRVKALILEEIALDERTDELKKGLLEAAEMLHIAALKLSRDNFGEKNVQTAKHYGNLGRLYQSMRQYDEAEKMHLRAIKIKEELLGPDDYEVGLSIGHLASLYNYHMKEYKEAETLYLRSIDINVKLFGTAYSGLEYDYRGLSHVYNKLSDHQKSIEYNRKMREWKNLREKVSTVKYKEPLLSPEEISTKFFAFARNGNKNFDKNDRYVSNSETDKNSQTISQKTMESLSDLTKNSQVKSGSE
ncbi:amyloid protein-binding protein 2 [Sitophilus oryzae]|uniref:Amyloid protein-binding protein 2 n=1 Tax=Sitophilus oryzae TaxID=7048 RepID=A0A6J2XUG1_SITOR|nr:amyloid protein-binding protein 2 [Sitophilus oryzae]